MKTELALNQLIQVKHSASMHLENLIGAYQFLKAGNWVSFKFKARSRNNSNHLEIFTNQDQTYDMKFSRVAVQRNQFALAFGTSGITCTKKEISVHKSLRDTEMRDTFETETGIALKA